MKKSTLSLIVAGLLATGAVAQAETFDTPTQAGEASTMTMGQPNQLTANSPYADNTVITDTTVLGAAPATMYVPMDHSVYVKPGWRDTYRQRHEAAATFNVPARAGEASTMTGGAPNMVTDNTRLAANSYVNVYSVPTSPYSSPGSLYYGS
jgi:hypothetical protein